MTDPQAPTPSAPPSQPPTIDLAGEPGPNAWHRISDRNPMFLISGVLMLAGCFLVSRHIHELEPADFEDNFLISLLVGLLVVMNLYEFAVIGLGLCLAKSRTLVRDARHLLGLAVLLLIDAAFVYTHSEIFSAGVGIVIAAVAVLLAWGKAWWIVRSLGIHPIRPALGVSAVSLAALYALPVALRLMADDGFLSQPCAMVVWTALGVLVALYALPRQWARLGVARSADHRQLQHLVAGGLVTLPLVSLIGHTAAALWVFENAFEPAMLSPVLLGFAALLLRHHRSLGGARPTAQAATLLAASAVVAALMPGDELVYESLDSSWVAFSPLRGVLLVAPALLVWAWWVGGRRPAGLVNAVLPLVAASLGHTPLAMARHLRWISESMTKFEWGLIAIAAAFLCLLVGGVMSRWRRGRERARAVASELLPGPA